MELESKLIVGYLPYGLKFDGKRKGWVSFILNKLVKKVLIN